MLEKQIQIISETEIVALVLQSDIQKPVIVPFNCLLNSAIYHAVYCKNLHNHVRG